VSIKQIWFSFKSICFSTLIHLKYTWHAWIPCEYKVHGMSYLLWLFWTCGERTKTNFGDRSFAVHHPRLWTLDGTNYPRILRLLTLWTRRAAFAASKFPCLTINGNADSRGTSAVFQTVTLFYAVCSIFPSQSSCFWPNKVIFFLREWYLAAILSLLPFSHINVEFMLKSSVFGE
jgi:hypothetical protein